MSHFEGKLSENICWLSASRERLFMPPEQNFHTNWISFPYLRTRLSCAEEWYCYCLLNQRNAPSRWRSYKMILLFSFKANDRRLSTAEARVRSRVSLCGICGWPIGTGTSFSPNTSGFPCHFHSTGAPLLGKMKKKQIIFLFITALHNKP